MNLFTHGCGAQIDRNEKFTSFLYIMRLGNILPQICRSWICTMLCCPALHLERFLMWFLKHVNISHKIEVKIEAGVVSVMMAGMGSWKSCLVVIKSEKGFTWSMNIRRSSILAMAPCVGSLYVNKGGDLLVMTGECCGQLLPPPSCFQRIHWLDIQAG